MLLQINNISRLCINNTHKALKRVFPIKISIYKSLFIVSFLFSSAGCEPNRVIEETKRPFQCIPSQSTCEVDTTFGTLLVKFNVDKVLTERPFNIRVEFKKDHLLNDNIRPENSYTIVGYMEGKTMFMGKIPLLFTEEAKNNPAYLYAPLKTMRRRQTYLFDL